MYLYSNIYTAMELKIGSLIIEVSLILVVLMRGSTVLLLITTIILVCTAIVSFIIN